MTSGFLGLPPLNYDTVDEVSCIVKSTYKMMMMMITFKS